MGRQSSLTLLSTVDITSVVRTGDPGVGETELLPLPAAALNILTILLDGPRHGYALMAEVRDLSGGTIRLGPGTLYGSIKRMLAQDLIVESENRPDEDDDERRRYYEITQTGRRVAAAEHARLARLLTFAQAAPGATRLRPAT